MPNYATLRNETEFNWYVSGSYTPLIELTETPMKEFYLDPSAGIHVYREGRKLLREIYPEDVTMPSPLTPPISYGHINCLGAELVFPDKGEVNYKVLCNSLEQGIEILEHEIDFATAGMMPFYLKYYEKLQQSFPEEPVGFGFKGEGPITTAYILRGEEFFLDPFDNPELTKKFLGMLTESIVKFKYFGSKLSGMRPGKLPEAGLTDDIAAMFAPGCWNEFIMPFLERFFTGLTDGKRSAHIEDLKAEHLKFLEQLNLSYYDPSVSPHLTPEIVGTESSVPFGWRLCDFHYRDMTNSDVENFVFKAAAGGASLVLSSIGHNMLTPEMVGKVHSFINAGKEAKKMLDNGVERQELLKLCSKTEKE